jgi:hypothetical protein
MKRLTLLLFLNLLSTPSIAEEMPLDFDINEAVETINPFTTDGCSKWFDGTVLGNHHEWLHCCEEHDVKYWAGIGGAQGHKEADLELRQCINDAGFPGYANLMYSAVRYPARPTNIYTNLPFRWGYGWNFILGRRTLNQTQIDSVKQMTATITTGIATYRNSKGYPAQTAEQQARMSVVIDRILKTPDVESPMEREFWNNFSENY